MDDNTEVTGEKVIAGIVHPRGCVGAGIGQSMQWSFQFHTWRDPDGMLQNTPIRIGLLPRDKSQDAQNYNQTMKTREERSAEAKATMFTALHNTYHPLDEHPLLDKIEPYKILKVKLNFVSRIQINLLEILDEDYSNDAELTQIASQLQEPITFEHEIFGIFTLEKRLPVFEAKVRWVGKDVTLWSSGDEDELNVAVQLWKNQDEWDEKAKEFAAQNMVDTVWIDDHEKPITIEDFKNRISLGSLSISPDGTFFFEYDDGWLFGGHSIRVEGSLDNGITEADISG